MLRLHPDLPRRTTMGRSGYDLAHAAPGSPAGDALARARARRPAGATPRAVTPADQRMTGMDDPDHTPRASPAGVPAAGVPDDAQCIDPRMLESRGEGQYGSGAGLAFDPMQGIQGPPSAYAAPGNAYSTPANTYPGISPYTVPGNMYANPGQGNVQCGASAQAPANMFSSPAVSYAVPENRRPDYGYTIPRGSTFSGNGNSQRNQGAVPSGSRASQNTYPDPESAAQYGFDFNLAPIREETERAPETESQNRERAGKRRRFQ